MPSAAAKPSPPTRSPRCPACEQASAPPISGSRSTSEYAVTRQQPLARASKLPAGLQQSAAFLHFGSGGCALVLYRGRRKKQQECERAKDQRSDYSRQFTVNQVSAKGTRHYKR